MTLLSLDPTATSHPPGTPQLNNLNSLPCSTHARYCQGCSVYWSGTCNLQRLHPAWHQLQNLYWPWRLQGTIACMLCQGQILALDSKAPRLKLLESAARKQGVSNVIRTKACQLQDLQQQHPELIPEGGFDRVLVDAPCSGTGTLAKRADLRWQRRAEDLPALCTLQVKHCASCYTAAA